MKNDFLYPYQDQCVTKALNTHKGKIILPTGSGKGVIGREIIFRIITSKKNKYNDFVGIIFTPRLILNKQ
jgi:superfamily II DNA or RNA helicase